MASNLDDLWLMLENTWQYSFRKGYDKSILTYGVLNIEKNKRLFRKLTQQIKFNDFFFMSKKINYRLLGFHLKTEKTIILSCVWIILLLLS